MTREKNDKGVVQAPNFPYNVSIFMKQRIIIVSIAVIIMAVAFFLGMRFSAGENGNGKTPESRSSASAGGGDTLPMSVTAVRDSSNPLYRITLEYPEFPSAPDVFNASLRDVVNSKLAQFKQDTEDNWKARQDTTPAGSPKPELPNPTPYFFNVSWQPKQLNPHYISFLVRFSSFIGGANERQELAAFNYDLTARRDIALADLFPGQADYLASISKYARQQLADALNTSSNGQVASDMLNEGTAPTVENFQNFIFDDDVIEFYFPKYQVAPGVFGEQHVVFLRPAAR